VGYCLCNTLVVDVRTYCRGGDYGSIHIGCFSASVGTTTALGGVYIGWGAGYQASCGVYNTMVGGYYAGAGHCSGGCNVAIGSHIDHNYGGLAEKNTSVGYDIMALGCFSFANVRCRNTLIGANIATNMGSGFMNTAIGQGSFNPVTNPTCGNILIGRWSGCAVCHCWNTIIGNTPGSGLTTSGNLLIADGAGNIEIYGTYQNRVGIECSAPPVTFAVAGNIFSTNEIIAYYSDRRLKDNIIVIDCALEKISKLNGVYYNANKLAESFGFNSKKQEVGLLADEVEKEFPQMVKLAPFDMNSDKETKSGENYKTVNYERMVAPLVEAIKEMSNFIDTLEHEYEILQMDQLA